MTEDETARFSVLKMANEGGKFAIPLGAGFNTVAEQQAFEGLLMEGAIRLIDIAPLRYAESSEMLFRIFMASEAAMTWFRSQH